MAKILGPMLLLKDYREKPNLSCLKELGNGEEAGPPVVVGQLKNHREKSNLSCLKELGDGEEARLPVVVGQLKNYRENPTVLSQGAWRWRRG
jgi:hypothetical protein